MSHIAQNQTLGPLSLDGGVVLAPGERAEIDPKSKHNKALEDEGKLLRIVTHEKEGKS